jgi:hypothetical protein
MTLEKMFKVDIELGTTLLKDYVTCLDLDLFDLSDEALVIKMSNKLDSEAYNKISFKNDHVNQFPNNNVA